MRPPAPIEEPTTGSRLQLGSARRAAVADVTGIGAAAGEPHIRPVGGRVCSPADSWDGRPGPRAAAVDLRTATANDAREIHRLILAHQQEGRLLPRTEAEVMGHAQRFVTGMRSGALVACGELAPLSDELAEIRSLVVDGEARCAGLGRAIVRELRRRAAAAGFERLCVFTHEPAYFVRLGFSITPHTWLPEKIAVDCRTCSLFRRCGQTAMILQVSHEDRDGPVASARSDP